MTFYLLLESILNLKLHRLKIKLLEWRNSTHKNVKSFYIYDINKINNIQDIYEKEFPQTVYNSLSPYIYDVVSKTNLK